MRTPLGATILVSIMILLDFYVFSALEAVSVYASPQTQTIIYLTYWTVAIVAIVGLVLFVLTDAHFMSKKIRTYLFATILAFFFAQIVASAFFLVDDVRRILQWIFQKAFAQQASASSTTIQRSLILSWAGLAAGTALFASLVLGFTNKYNYRVKRIKLAFKNLPEAFYGFKIVHFSDVHSGSFMNKKAVEEGVEKILDQKADLIIFSGDLVNDRATEMENYKDVFSRIK
ncbi:MAG: metallophosphoesterase, partial [Ginsengibacter sp.]